MRHYQQLSKAERHVMQKMNYNDITLNKIALYLDRHPSTLYNEYKRNKTKGYHFQEAHEKAWNRRYTKQYKIDSNPILKMLVITLLIQKNSPEVISKYLKEFFSNDPTSKTWTSIDDIM